MGRGKVGRGSGERWPGVCQGGVKLGPPSFLFRSLGLGETAAVEISLSQPSAHPLGELDAMGGREEKRVTDSSAVHSFKITPFDVKVGASPSHPGPGRVLTSVLASCCWYSLSRQGNGQCVCRVGWEG